jgi:hypothetical protein
MATDPVDDVPGGEQAVAFDVSGSWWLWLVAYDALAGA